MFGTMSTSNRTFPLERQVTMVCFLRLCRPCVESGQPVVCRSTVSTSSIRWLELACLRVYAKRNSNVFSHSHQALRQQQTSVGLRAYRSVSFMEGKHGLVNDIKNHSLSYLSMHRIHIVRPTATMSDSVPTILNIVSVRTATP